MRETADGAVCGITTTGCLSYSYSGAPGEICALPCLPVYHAESGRESGMDTHTCPPATQDTRGGRLCLSLFSGMIK